MPEKSIIDRVIAVIAKQLGLKPIEIKPESSFAELGGDTLDHIETVIELERVFAIVIEDHEIDSLLTVIDFANVVAKHPVLEAA